MRTNSLPSQVQHIPDITLVESTLLFELLIREAEQESLEITTGELKEICRCSARKISAAALSLQAQGLLTCTELHPPQLKDTDHVRYTLHHEQIQRAILTGSTTTSP